MPVKKRIKTRYNGVYYVDGQAIGSNKAERVYYIRYRKKGKMIEEKAGRQFQGDMTPAKASNLRSLRIEGNQLSNQEKRSIEEAKRRAEENRWTVSRLWMEYMNNKPNLKGIVTDKNRFENYFHAGKQSHIGHGTQASFPKQRFFFRLPEFPLGKTQNSHTHQI